MNAALLGVCIVVVLVVLAAATEAYLKRATKRPLSRARPTRIAKRASGQFATDTTLLQDVLEERERRKTAQT